MKILKIISIALSLVISANAYDVTQHAKELADKAKKDADETQKWLDRMESKFDKKFWENLRKTEYEKELKEGIVRAKKREKKRGIKIDMKREKLFAKNLADCSVKERFYRWSTDEGYSVFLNEYKEEAKKYKEFLRSECWKAKMKYKEYVESL